jgi:hypothetical protein
VLNDGRFEIDGLAGGVYRLRVRLGGCRLSPRNKSYDSFHAGGELRGIVQGDAIDLQVLLEPGPEPADVDTGNLNDGEREKFFADHEEKGKLPLRGLVE